MNISHVFFWNDFNIWYFDINTDEHEMHKLELFVDPQDKNTKVKTVRTGSTDDKVAIIVR